jgi:AraC-like DNA-binding protein
MILQIRNMASDRCIVMVKNELKKMGLHFRNVLVGEVDIKENLSKEKLQMFDNALKDVGLELIEDKESRIVEKIKACIEQLIGTIDDLHKSNFPDSIHKNLNLDYTYLSTLFSRIQGVTIEKYIIQRKIEHVKDLLVFDNLTLSDIAYRMQYSSVAHLSNQFKKVTGYTPSVFKQLRNNAASDRQMCESYNSIKKLCNNTVELQRNFTCDCLKLSGSF